MNFWYYIQNYINEPWQVVGMIAFVLLLSWFILKRCNPN